MNLIEFHSINYRGHSSNDDVFCKLLQHEWTRNETSSWICASVLSDTNTEMWMFQLWIEGWTSALEERVKSRWNWRGEWPTWRAAKIVPGCPSSLYRSVPIPAASVVAQTRRTLRGSTRVTSLMSHSIVTSFTLAGTKRDTVKTLIAFFAICMPSSGMIFIYQLLRGFFFTN